MADEALLLCQSNVTPRTDEEDRWSLLNIAELDPEERLIEALRVLWFDLVLFIVSDELLCLFF